MSRVVSIGGLNINDWTVDDQTGAYVAWFEAPFTRPPLTTIMAAREGSWPVGVKTAHDVFGLPPLHIQIMDTTNEATLRPQLFVALDTSAAFKALIISDDDGSNERYVMVSVQTVEERDEARGTGKAFVATLVVVGDPAWRSVEMQFGGSTLTASGQTFAVTNSGRLDAYPTFVISPNTIKSGTNHWVYHQFVLVRWQSPVGETRYPIRVSGDTDWDTTGLTPTKAAGDGTGTGVVVDNELTDRWFGGANTATGGWDSTTTRMWANLDFQPGKAVTLAADMPDEGVFEVTVNEDISDWPHEGILYLPAEDELIAYTGKDNYRKTFTDIRRAAYGTARASHLAGDAVEWIQHEVYIVYTPGLNMVITTDDSKRPLIDLLTSTNASWTWNNTGVNTGFGSAAEPERPGQWLGVTGGSGETFAGHQQGAATDPYDVVGIDNTSTEETNSFVRWQTYLACGIFDYDADGRDHVNGTTALFSVSVNASSWSNAGETPGSGAGWATWTETATALNTSWRYLAFRSNGASLSQLEAITITLHNELRPIVTRQEENSNYDLNMTLDNQTTGEAMTLRWPAGYVPNIQLFVETEARRIYALTDLLGRYHILTRNTLRPHMLRLAPGVNTIQVTDSGTTSVGIAVEWEERSYS
jgi:hypothetical protein